jgi:hypothetical protein
MSRRCFHAGSSSSTSVRAASFQARASINSSMRAAVAGGVSRRWFVSRSKRPSCSLLSNMTDSHWTGSISGAEGHKEARGGRRPRNRNFIKRQTTCLIALCQVRTKDFGEFVRHVHELPRIPVQIFAILWLSEKCRAGGRCKMTDYGRTFSRRGKGHGDHREPAWDS